MVENPSYLAALQAFAGYEAEVVALPGDGDGLRTELLEEGILENRPELIYVVPDFQNPKGTTLAPHRRKRAGRGRPASRHPGARGRPIR